jgi:mannose-6-phosphate isomerase-like protein (cupin superfamily)
MHGERDTIVVCIEGEGYTSVGDETVPLGEGQQVRWPRVFPHRLWTEDSTMSTLIDRDTSTDRTGPRTPRL